MATTAAPRGPAAKTALGAGLAAGLAATLALVLLAGVIAAILGNQGCPSPNGSEPTGQAKTDIPADYLRPYQQAGEKFNWSCPGYAELRIAGGTPLGDLGHV